MKSTSVPDACSLSQPELADRLDWLRRQIPRARALRPIEVGGAGTSDAFGVVLHFGPEPELRDALARWVSLEDACCDPEAIRFTLLDDGADGSLRLEIRGLRADSPWLREIAPAAPTASTGGIRRLAKAGGLAGAAALALLCGLPPLLAAVAGAAVAAPLAGLESPFALAAGSLLLGALAWWALGRRRRAKDPLAGC